MGTLSPTNSLGKIFCYFRTQHLKFGNLRAPVYVATEDRWQEWKKYFVYEFMPHLDQNKIGAILAGEEFNVLLPYYSRLLGRPFGVAVGK